MLAPPDVECTEQPITNLTRWRLVQRMHGEFWKKYQNEYLARLQNRSKWLNGKPEIQVGDLVLLREPNIPPMQWPRGRIIEVHPGIDGHTRVVTVKTARTIIKRPVVKVCLLPSPTPPELMGEGVSKKPKRKPNHQYNIRPGGIRSLTTILLLARVSSIS